MIGWGRAETALVALAAALCVFGGWQHDLFGQVRWPRVVEAVVYVGFVSLVARLIARGGRVDVARAAAVVVGVVHVAMLGIVGSAAVAALALIAMAIGSRLVGQVPARPWIALLAGLALCAGVVGWLLPYRVHAAPVYLLVGGLLVWSRRQDVRALWREIVAPWWSSEPLPEAARWIVPAIGYVAITAWLPTTQFDDVVYHLGLPYQLQTLGYYRMDAVSQVWALAPWATDVLQGIAQVVGATEARGALNTLFLIVALHLLWQLLAFWRVDARWRWWGIALFATQPLISTLLHSMQTELISLTIALALALLAASTARGERRETWWRTGAILIGFALGCKVSNVVWVGLIALWVLWQARCWPWTRILAAVGWVLLIGGSSYAYAWKLTGNPVLPLFNDVFQSSLFPVERWYDPTYRAGLHWDTIYQLVVNTNRYQEGWDGTAGFQWLVFAPLLLLAWRHRALRAAWLVGIVGFVVMFLQMQYLRYQLPSLAILAAVMAVAIARASAARGFALITALVMTVNLAFMGNVNWMLHHAVIARIGQDGIRYREAFLREYLPERLLAAHLRSTYGPNFFVYAPLDFEPAVAELAGRGVTVSWYDPTTNALAAAATGDTTGEAHAKLARSLGATHVVVREARVPRAVRAFLRREGTVELSINGAALYRLRQPNLLEDVALDPRAPLSGESLRWERPWSAQGQALASFTLELACARAGTAARADLWRQVEGGWESVVFDYQVCGDDGRLHLSAQGKLSPATRALRLSLEPGASPAPAEYAVRAVTLTARADTFRDRDRSQDAKW